MAIIRQEINITNASYWGNGAYDSIESVLLDTTKYNGATYYFEVVTKSVAGNTGTIRLRRKGTTTDDATITGTVNTTYTLLRVAFTPPVGATEYVLALVGDAVTIQYVLAARIIIIQDASPIISTETQIEVGSNS